MSVANIGPGQSDPIESAFAGYFHGLAGKDINGALISSQELVARNVPLADSMLQVAGLALADQQSMRAEHREFNRRQAIATGLGAYALSGAKIDRSLMTTMAPFLGGMSGVREALLAYRIDLSRIAKRYAVSESELQERLKKAKI